MPARSSAAYHAFVLTCVIRGSGCGFARDRRWRGAEDAALAGSAAEAQDGEAAGA